MIRKSTMRQTQQEESRKLNAKSILFAALYAFTFSFSSVGAQETLSATGGNASGSGGSVSYSAGQVVYKTHTGTAGSVAEGVQQPYEISVVSANEKIEGINLSVTAYPNPATDNLILEISNSELLTLTFHLYDMQGKLLQSEKITGNQTQINMNGFVPATYFVKVIQENKEIITFKVVKR